MSEPTPSKPKIIIDEDWKDQVEEEKEVLRQQHDEKDDAGPETASVGELPPASFESHVMSLATQAAAALGQLPDPEHPDQQPPIHADHGKYIIDTLRILQEKTQGNLSMEEADRLENVLHQLRLIYVEVAEIPPS